MVYWRKTTLYDSSLRGDNPYLSCRKLTGPTRIQSLDWSVIVESACQITCISCLSCPFSRKITNFTFLPFRRCFSDSERNFLKSMFSRKSLRVSALCPSSSSHVGDVSSALLTFSYSRLATVSMQLDKSGISSITGMIFILGSRRVFVKEFRMQGLTMAR